MKKAITSKKVPSAIGPYSQGTINGGLVFVSGQLPINVITGKFAGDDIVTQTKKSLENVKNILNEAGLDMCDVMKATVYLKDMNDFKGMNSVYAEFFEEPYPARAAFEVAKLPLNALVEIEVIAIKK